MANPKRPGSANGDESPETARELQRISNLLALLLVKGESEAEKVLTLSAAGFGPAEVASLLRKVPNTVSVILYKAKQAAKNPKSAKKATPR